MVLITDRSRLEDKDTSLKWARGMGKARQNPEKEKGKFLSQRTQYRRRESRTELCPSLEREGEKERGVYLKVFEEVGSLGTLPQPAIYNHITKIRVCVCVKLLQSCPTL